MYLQRSRGIFAVGALCASIALFSSGCDFQQEQLNPKEAYQKSLESAEQGDPKGMFELAYACSRGLGTEKDINKALEHLKSAAQAGHGRAQLMLGEIYLQANRGRDLDKMVKVREEWYQAAKRDKEEGYKWLLRAELNDDESISGPAEGILVEMVKDMGEADRERFFKVAAEHGHLDWQEIAKKMAKGNQVKLEDNET